MLRLMKNNQRCWRNRGQTHTRTDWKEIHLHNMFARKGWRSSIGIDRKLWQCTERRLSVKMKRSEKICRLGVVISEWLIMFSAIIIIVKINVRCKIRI